MLEVKDVTKRFGARTLLDRVSLRIDPGSRIGLVGRNGEGKTTLLKLLAGLDAADEGEIRLQRGTRTGYLRQEVDATAGHSVLEEASRAQAQLRDLERELRALEHQIARQGERGQDPDATLVERYAATQQVFEVRGGFEADAELRATLSGLGLGPTSWERPLRELSGGWLMRVELAKLLLARPEVLLLDEPTNHLDLPSIQWFENMLRQYPGAIVVVSHDRSFLDRQATAIAELEGGRLHVFRGNYSAYQEERQRRLDEADTRRRALQRQIDHAARFVERFGAKATKATQAESRKKQIARWEAERDALPQEAHRRSIRLRFPEAPRSGDVVLRLEGISKAYGDHWVYRDLDLELRRGDRIALVGPNGAGKTTLLRIVAGALAPDSGTRELGHNVFPAYFAQHQVEALDDARSVLEEIEHDAPLDWVPRLRSLLGSFLFAGDDVYKKVGVLSGGERARLALAKLLLRGANFLILDEPTNHLDIPAIDVITQALRDFSGTLLLISHDRHFIDQLVNRVLEVTPGQGASRATAHLGNYSEFLRAQEHPAPAAPSPFGAPGGPAQPSTAPATSPASTSPEPSSASQSTGRLSKNALRRLREESEDLQRSIIDAETERDRLDQLLFHPDVVRDGERSRALGQDRAKLEALLEELYERWQEIEESLSDA